MTPSVLTLTATLCQSGQCLDLSSAVTGAEPPTWTLDLPVPGGAHRVRVEATVPVTARPPQPVFLACLVQEDGACSWSKGVPVMGEPVFFSWKARPDAVEIELVIRAAP